MLYLQKSAILPLCARVIAYY